MEKNNHLLFMQRAVDLSLENVMNGNGGPLVRLLSKTDRSLQLASIKSHYTTIQQHMLKWLLSEMLVKPLATSAHRLPTIHLMRALPMCLGAIFWARPSIVYFANSAQDAAHAGFDDSFIYDQIALDREKRAIACIHIPIAHALKAFSMWTATQHKIPY